MKRVYTAPDEDAALSELHRFDRICGEKYSKIAVSWRNNWVELSTYFKYPDEVRKLIYTTNTIEGFNRKLRKVTKSKSVFPTDDSLFMMLYLATVDTTSKWTGKRRDWGKIYSILQFSLMIVSQNKNPMLMVQSQEVFLLDMHYWCRVLLLRGLE